MVNNSTEMTWFSEYIKFTGTQTHAGSIQYSFCGHFNEYYESKIEFIKHLLTSEYDRDTI